MNILCFGDSNTYGYRPDGTGRFDEKTRWTCLLQKKFGNRHRIIEEGLCGRTTIFSDAFREGRRGLDQIGITIETHNPIDLLILMLGTNDCKTHFNASSKTIAKGLIQVIEKAKKYSSQPFELLIISPIHLGNGVGDDDFDPEFDLASEQVSRQLAQEYRKSCHSLSRRFSRRFKKLLFQSEIDREHLDESGHAALADAIYKTITESGLLEKGMDSSFCHIA